MAKIHVNLSVDDEIVKDAKEQGINLSEAAEKGLLEQLGKKTVTLVEPTQCSICKNGGRRETATNLRDKRHFSEPTNLTWLYPDEIWLCNKCLRFKVEILKKGKN